MVVDAKVFTAELDLFVTTLVWCNAGGDFSTPHDEKRRRMTDLVIRHGSSIHTAAHSFG